jgi:hypothetical protein
VGLVKHPELKERPENQDATSGISTPGAEQADVEVPRK